MTKTTKIENELNQVTKRIDELNEMREGIKKNLETLQSGFIDGKTPIDAMQAEQSKLTALNASIETLENNQSELHSAFQMASLTETRSELLESAKKTAIEAEKLFNEYQNLRTGFNDSIEKQTEGLIVVSSKFRAKQQELAKISDALAPGTIDAPTYKLRDLLAPLNSELNDRGVSNETLAAARMKFINSVPLKFGCQISDAEDIVARESYAANRAVV